MSKEYNRNKTNDVITPWITFNLETQRIQDFNPFMYIAETCGHCITAEQTTNSVALVRK
jgi:hypothetical protein